jgi:outer membrane protein assembly factor BamB
MTMRIVLGVMLATAAASLPDRRAFVEPWLPVIARWSDAAAQRRLVMPGVPYDLLSEVDRSIPRNAALVLVTPGGDVRGRERIVFHRALYVLAPRPVWWAAPAAPDGTWESRWFIPIESSAEAVVALAERKRAQYILALGGPEIIPRASKTIGTGEGSLWRLGGARGSATDGANATSVAARVGTRSRRGASGPPEPESPGRFWEMRLAGALAVVLLLGSTVVTGARRLGWSVSWIESVGLSWIAGVGIVSLGMFWLGSVGLGLGSQILALTAAAIIGSSMTRWRTPPSSSIESLARPELHRARPGFASVVLIGPLVVLLVAHVLFAAALAVGRPLQAWDSWVAYGMKARVIFLEGHVSEAVYADPSREATHQSYPLLLSLVQAWTYGWIGAPDDRLAGVASLLFYLSLMALVFGIFRRRGASPPASLAAAAAAGSMGYVAILSGLVYADVPLLVYATAAGSALAWWIERGNRGALLVGAVCAGLGPWTKREGVVLVLALAAAVVVTDRAGRRSRVAVAAMLLAVLLACGPWWTLTAWRGVSTPGFQLPGVAALVEHADRLPAIARMLGTALLSPWWNFIWPLAVVSGFFRLAVARATGRRGGSPLGSASAAALVFPLTAGFYLVAMAGTYVFSVFVPFEQHVETSIHRLVAHVTVMPLLWLAWRQPEPGSSGEGSMIRRSGRAGMAGGAAPDQDERGERMTRLHGWLIAVVALTGFAVVITAQPRTSDWPQWRGLNRDGAALGFTEPAAWPETLTQKWKVDVGLGYAAPITVGPRTYLFTRQEPNEVMRALDVQTGQVVWEVRYPAPFKPNPAATRRHGTGPKSTPTFAGGRLYSFGMSGIVTAFDAATGKQIWQKPGGPVEPMYHTAMSPLVDRGLVILHVGGHNNGALTAFDAGTGEVKWAWTGDGPAYGSPIVAEFAGTRQVITLTQENLVGVSAATGELLWRRPFAVRATRNAVTPILHGASILVSGLEKGVTAFTVGRRDGQWTTSDAWENTEVTMDMSTGVLIGDTLYGFSPRSSGQYFAIDAATGRTLWLTDGRQAENAAVVRAGNLWFALEDDAELVVVRANPKAFDPVRRYTVADSATWAQPVLSSTGVLVKDVSSVALWGIK